MAVPDYREERRWQYLDANVKQYVILPYTVGWVHILLSDTAIWRSVQCTLLPQSHWSGEGGGGIQGSKKQTNL